MKLRNRLSMAYKVLTQQQLGNSLGSIGNVVRNSGYDLQYRPFENYRGVTFKAVDKTATSLSVYQPKLLKANGDAYTSHPLLSIFNRPNPNQNNASDFIYLYSSLMDIYGETFWYKAKGEVTGRLKELYLLDPSRIELKVENGEVYGYVLHKADGNQVPFTPDEIYHDKISNPFNEWRGLSIMEKAAIYSETEIVTAVFTLNYMKNNASPSGIVTLPKMAPDAFKTFTAEWRENYEGPQNAGKTGFIRGGEANFQAIGATLKDVDQKVTRDMAKEDVLMMMDVPKALVGLTDDNGFGRANVETFKYIFAESKLEPRMLRLDRVYTELLKDLPQTAQAAKVTHVSPVPEDKEYNLNKYTKAVNIWMTVNEVRAKEGLEPIDGGDELKAPQQVTLGLQQKTAKRITMKQESLTDTQEEFRKNLVGNNNIYARKLKSELSDFADKQEAQVIKNINASSKSYEEWLFSVKEQSEELAVIMLPIIIELMEEQSKDVANFITGEALTLTPEIKAAARQDVLRISGLYNDETIKSLQKTLAEGQSKGESLVKLKKRVEQVYSDAKGYRAERIARTESLRASNATAELVYGQNGYSEVKWFVNPGACEFCRSFSGRTKTIGGKYSAVGDVITGDEGGQLKIDYSDIQTPPLHPNCTCSLVPVK